MRIATIERKTNETKITVKLNIDGSGQADINTGIGFLDHMLHHIAVHGLFDLTLHADGDLHVDEHHTVEDCALVLGQAFAQALGDKKALCAQRRPMYPWTKCWPSWRLIFPGGRMPWCRPNGLRLLWAALRRRSSGISWNRLPCRRVAIYTLAYFMGVTTITRLKGCSRHWRVRWMRRRALMSAARAKFLAQKARFKTTTKTRRHKG